MTEISPNLLKGLQSVEAGAIPTLITHELEAFLTEHGLYSTSMTPEDAWKALQKVAGRQTPATATSPTPAGSQMIGQQPVSFSSEQRLYVRRPKRRR